MEQTTSAIGTWRLSFRTERGEENPVVALAADGTGIYQSPEGALPVTAIFDGNDVSFHAVHKTVMRDFPIRFRGSVRGDSFDGAMLTVAGPHPVSGHRIA